MLRDSIKGRLIATVILSQSLLAAGLLFAGVFYTHRRLLSTLDAGMQAHAMSVAALVRYTEDASGNVYFDDSLMPQSLDPNHPDLFAVLAERSGLLVRSANWPSGLNLEPDGGCHWNFSWNSVPYRALRVSKVPVLDREESQSFQPQTLTIVYAAPMVRLREQVRAAGVFIALASLVLLGMTVMLALWGIRRGLSPLRHLAGQAALVTAHRWDFRPPDDAQQIAELRPLTQSMTNMLGGLEQSLEDLDRLERLLQWMLRLARAEQWAHGALRRDLQVIDLAATCEEAVERIRTLAQARNTSIHLSTNGPVPLRADHEDLQLVWINLLENAVRYSPEGASVEVAVTRQDGSPAQVIFEDHGAGIAAADLPHVFERFYRGDPSRTRATGGFGLGLAIAKAVVEAYGGTITADSAPGKGTRMTVELPGR